VRITRLPGNPIIRPHMDGRMGDNINGPSLIRVPQWVPSPLGRYYLYFAHHSGKYIRLAYADALSGPWRTYEPGTLQLEESGFRHHVASPDVMIDEAQQRIVMFFHGAFLETNPRQATRVAFSSDGIHFETQPDILGKAYWRVFAWRDRLYALAKPGLLFRSSPGRPWKDFEPGPQVFPQSPELFMRHLAVDLRGDRLDVYFSRVGDTPERILRSSIWLNEDWSTWRPSEPETVIEPETEWEGVDEPLQRSTGGQVHGPVRQLRDPAIYREAGRTYLLYSVAGERGIGIALLEE